jgi:hypothetical protein
MNFLKDLLRDKMGDFSLRELVIAICMLLVVSSWIAQLVFNIPTPDNMFYAVVGLIATGCFGYSIEKKPNNNQEKKPL